MPRCRQPLIRRPLRCTGGQMEKAKSTNERLNLPSCLSGSLNAIIATPYGTCVIRTYGLIVTTNRVEREEHP